MIRQYLSNKNENVTVPKTKNFSEGLTLCRDNNNAGAVLRKAPPLSFLFFYKFLVGEHVTAAVVLVVNDDG